MEENAAAGLNRERLLFKFGYWLASNRKTKSDYTDWIRFHVVEFPDSYNARYALGDALQGVGDNAGAKKCYTRCLELFPGFVHAQRRLDLVLLQEKWGSD